MKNSTRNSIFKNIIAFKISLLAFLLNGYSQEAALTSVSSNGTGIDNSNAQSTVNMSTGTVSTSIPLATLTSNGYSFPISLNYNATGIRVDQESDWVGLGFSLFTGGSISWNVVGIRDDAPTIAPETGGDNLQNGGFFNTMNSLVVVGENVRNVFDNKLDIQPDEFYFSTPRSSGMFLFKKETFVSNANTLTPVTIPYQPLKIERTGNYYSGNTFKITDESGYQYTYNSYQGVHATSKSSESDYVDLPLNYAADYETTKFLDETRDYNNNLIFDFQYSSTYKTSSRTSNGQRAELRDGEAIYDRPIINTEYTTTQNTKRISKIVYDGGYLVFNRSKVQREDIPNEFSLKDICFYNEANVLLKRINFEYDYFENTNGTKKLMLKKVWEEDATGAAITPYIFEYDIRMPNDRNSQDHWGFYNGANNENLIPESPYTADLPTADRDVNPYFVQAGILNKIIFPTGANKTFIYESNDYGRYSGNSTTQNSVIAGGVRIKKIITDDGDSDISNNVVQYYKYKMTEPFDTNRSSGYLLNYPRYDYWQFADCDECGSWIDGVFFNYNYDHERFITDSQTQNQSLVSKDGIVSYEFVSVFDCDLDLFPNCQTNTGHIEYEYVYAPLYDDGNNTGYLIPNNSYDFYWKRNLLASKSVFKGDGTLLNKVVNSYEYPELNTVDAAKIRVKNILIHTDKNFKKIDITNIYRDNYKYRSQWIKQTGSIEYNYQNGAEVKTITTINYNDQYKKPIEIIKEFDDGSQTRQKMSYLQDFTTVGGSVTSDKYTMRMLKEKNVFANPVYTTTEYKSPWAGSSYIYTTAQINMFGRFTENFVDYYYLPSKSYSIDINQPISSLVLPSLNTNGNLIFDGEFKLKSKVNKYYFNDNTILPQKTEDENGLKKSVLFHSNFKVPVAEISYQNNDFSLYWSYEEGNSDPEDFYGGGTANTAVVASPVTIPKNAVTGLRYLKINSDKNVSYEIPHGEYVLSFWSNEDPNLSFDNIVVTRSFKDGVGATNNWQYNEYILRASGSGIGEGNLNNIYISRNNMAIDELRIYPKYASMNTTCYNSSGQVISTCDINNNIMHTEYDSFQRVKITKDRNQNIIKKYNYGQADSDSFFNDYISKIYNKNDCPVGQYPLNLLDDLNDFSDYPIKVEIEAGDFTSQISKSEANYLAQTYIQENGQTIVNQQMGCSACTASGFKLINSVCQQGILEDTEYRECCNPNEEKAQFRYKFPDGYGPEFFGQCYDHPYCNH